MFYVYCEIDVVTGKGARSYDVVCIHKLGAHVIVPPFADPMYKMDREYIEAAKHFVSSHCLLCNSTR